MRRTKAGLMFIELLVAAAIILFVAFNLIKLYSKNTSINKETQKLLSGSGIDTTTYKTTIDSTKNKIADIQNKHFEELNRLEEEQNY
jgi:hypothetical protein